MATSSNSKASQSSSASSTVVEAMAELQPTSFSAIKGWQEEDHLAAFSCFRVSAKRMAIKPYSTKKLQTDALALAQIASKALAPEMTKLSAEQAKQFFENHFDPFWVKPREKKLASTLHTQLAQRGSEAGGFVTGYFEPEIEASTVKTDEFIFPILKRPMDLANIDDQTRPKSMASDFFFARDTGKEGEGRYVEYYDRRAIEAGAIDDQKLEIFWFKNRIDIFFIHIQGSARLVLTDGSIKRISYAAKSGHPFTAIGKLLIQRGELTLENVTMGTIRGWLEDHAMAADDLMRENRSYIFFQEIDHPEPLMGPIAAAGVALTPGRSLAIDHRLHTFGTPVFVSCYQHIPGSSQPFRRLMIAQDTGSAIIGPARGDLYIGTGKEAGDIAGGIKNDAEFIVLQPKPQTNDKTQPLPENLELWTIDP